MASILTEILRMTLEHRMKILLTCTFGPPGYKKLKIQFRRKKHSDTSHDLIHDGESSGGSDTIDQTDYSTEYQGNFKTNRRDKHENKKS